MKLLREEASLRVLHSSFESLEVTAIKRPGKSAQFQSSKWQLANRAFGVMGFRVECAFDTIITIAEKNKPLHTGLASNRQITAVLRVAGILLGGRTLP
jgi:hypothetical protein